MASPFEIFRRNQWLVVALFGLSIFAFVLLDPLTTGGGDSNLFPIVLGVLLGGVAAWLISNTTGRTAVLWAAAGGVAGGLFVGLAGDFFGSNVAVRTTAGDLTRSDLAELDQQNRIANQFFGSLKRTLADREPENQDLLAIDPPNFDFTGARTVGNQFFGYRQLPNVLGANTPREYGLVFGYLLGQEADEAGLEVSDERVNTLINSHFGVFPTRDEIREIRTNLRVDGRSIGETELFDAIKAELRQQDMFSLLRPNPTALPTDAWELYRKVNQTANVAYVELPVQEFVPAAPEPTEAEVADLFDRYRTQEPDPFTKLGFLRPFQMSLGYLEADRTAVTESVSTPTDEEVKTYYETNKAAYRNEAYDQWLIEERDRKTRAEVDAALDAEDDGADMPGPGLPAPAPAEPSEPADEPQPEPADEPTPETPADEPAMEAPADEPTPADEPSPAPADEPADEPEMGDPVAGGASLPDPIEPGADEGETPAGEPASEPAEEPNMEEPAAEEPASEEPAAEEPAAEEPAAEEPAGEEPSSEEPADEPTTEEPAEELEEEEASEESAAVRAPFEAAGFASLPLAPQEENGEEQPPAEALDAESDDEPTDGAEPPADAPAMTADDGETAGDGETADDTPGDGEAQGDGTDAAPPAPSREKPEEYLPLDAERTEEIRALLKRQAVNAEMTRRIEAARDAMFVFGQEIWAEVPVPEDPTVTLKEEEIEELRTAAKAEIAERMKAYAAEHGLTYKRLPFLSLQELTGGDYPVGTAEAPAADQFAQPQLAIAPLLSNYQTPLFSDVRLGETPDGSALFAIWKAGQRFAAEQELDDEGVRESVVEAFKWEKATAAAAARADELAELASAENKTLQEVVAGKTVTGEEGGTDLEVTETGPFTRLRVNRPTGIQALIDGPSPVRNRVPEVGAASEEFLNAAFDTLAPGEAAGVPGYDPDRSFTIELLSREPTDERLSELYEAFLQDAAATPRLYQQAASQARQESLQAFVDGLFDKYGVDREAIGALAVEQ